MYKMQNRDPFEKYVVSSSDDEFELPITDNVNINYNF